MSNPFPIASSLKTMYVEQSRVLISVLMDDIKIDTYQRSIIHNDTIRFTLDLKGDWESVRTPWRGVVNPAADF